MHRIQEGLQNFKNDYFNGFQNLKNKKNPDNKTIHTLQVLSYFTGIIPAGFAIAKGAKLLKEHLFKPKASDETDDVAQNIFRENRNSIRLQDFTADHKDSKATLDEKTHPPVEPDEIQYEGRKYKGEKDSEGNPTTGTLIYGNGDTYRGKVNSEGNPADSDNGIFNYNDDNRTYQGPVRDGKPSTQGEEMGTIVYDGGNIFRGQVNAEGKPNSNEKGALVFPNQNRFRGQIDHNGKPIGAGVLRYADPNEKPDDKGTFFRGTINDEGIPQGSGTIIFPSSKGNLKYQGPVNKEGLPDPEKPPFGILTSSDKQIFKGPINLDGTPITTKVIGDQKYTILSDGTMFSGKLDEKGNPDGEGEWMFNDGSHQRGTFTNGILDKTKPHIIFDPSGEVESVLML